MKYYWLGFLFLKERNILYFQVAESPGGDLMGYIMGKCEGVGENWHGHVTAVTVGPEYRRLGKYLLYYTYRSYMIIWLQ